MFFKPNSRQFNSGLDSLALLLHQQAIHTYETYHTFHTLRFYDKGSEPLIST